MADTPNQSPLEKPLAGECVHRWQEQPSPYLTAEVCVHCKLYRYKSNLTADWEYRAPIPIARASTD